MKRHLLIITASTFLSLSSIVSLAQTTADQNTTTTTQSTTATNTQDTSKETNILAVIEQIDKNEINAANVALSKTTNDDVKDFADDMKSDHQKNLEDAHDLIKKLNLSFTTSEMATSLAKKGETGLKGLESMQGSQFDKAYIDAMVKGHTEALNFINMTISKTANADSDFVDFLKDTQKTVSHHLDEAKEVQAKLQK